MSLSERLAAWPRERLAQRLSAACYGTVLVLVALPLIQPADVSDGLGWELVTGVGLATWIAHLYAELVAARVHQSSPLVREEVVTAWPITSEWIDVGTPTDLARAKGHS